MFKNLPIIPTLPTFNTFIGPFSLLYHIPPFLAAIVPLFIFVGVDFILLGVFS